MIEIKIKEVTNGYVVEVDDYNIREYIFLDVKSLLEFINNFYNEKAENKSNKSKDSSNNIITSYSIDNDAVFGGGS